MLMFVNVNVNVNISTRPGLLSPDLIVISQRTRHFLESQLFQ